MTPFKIVLAFSVLAFLGFILLPKLSIDLLPRAKSPTLLVSFALKDAPPEILESQATAPLETALSQLNNLKRIYSISNHEQGTIELVFDENVDMDFKRFEVTSIIRNIYDKLNSKISYPIVTQNSATGIVKSPLLVYRIYAKLTPFEIKRIGEDVLRPALSSYEGIDEIIFQGANEVQLSIEYDYKMLKDFGVTSQDILTALQTSFKSFYPGAIVTHDGNKFMISGGKTARDIPDINNVLIALPSKNSIALNKLARVYYEETKPQQFFRINGSNAVSVAITSDDGVNRLKLANSIKSQINQLRPHLPSGFEIDLSYDDSEFLQQEINKNLIRSGLSFLILISFLATIYRSGKHLMVLFSGIIVSLGFTALVSYFLGVDVHLYTIAGLTISLGIIIDNSIVVIDHLKTKKDRKIVRAVLGSAATTVWALTLVLFLPEEERLNLTEFCIIISIAISCSALVAIFFTPSARILFHSSDVLKKLTIRKVRQRIRYLTWYSRLITTIRTYRKTFICCLIIAFGLPVFLIPSKIDGNELFNKTIGSEYYQDTVKLISDKIFGGTMRMFVDNIAERSGYRESTQTQLLVIAQLPHGNTLEEMNRVLLHIEAFLEKYPGIDNYVTQINSPQNGRVTITFTEDSSNGSSPYQLRNRLVAMSLEWGGVTWNIYGVGQGFTNSATETVPTLKAELRGYDFNVLGDYAEVLGQKLAEHKRIQNINTNERLSYLDKNNEQYILDFSQSAYTSSLYKLALQLQEQTDRNFPASRMVINSQEYPVYLKPSGMGSLSTVTLLEANLVSTDSLNFRLSSTAKLRKELAPTSIHKENRQYIRNVAFEYLGNYSFGAEFLDKVITETKGEMVPGYSIKPVTYSWDKGKSQRQYSLIIFLAIGVYFICSILFESLRQPLFIMATIPLSFIGIFLTFFFFELYFDQGGFAAFILLGGLVANASIYIVNDLNNLKRGDYNRNVLKAVTGKMRPILLTVTSTCLGLLPFILIGENEVFWYALAAGTIGGLIFSLFSVFVFLPVMLLRAK